MTSRSKVIYRVVGALILLALLSYGHWILACLYAFGWAGEEEMRRHGRID